MRRIIAASVAFVPMITQATAAFARRRVAAMQTRPRIDAERVRAEKFDILRRISAGMAHKINNPLTVILGVAELLRRSPELAGRDGAQDDILLIVSAARRCEKAVMDLSRIAFGEVKAAESVDVVALVADAVAAERRDCEAAMVSLVVEAPNAVLRAFAAKGSLARGLRAMIANSREAIVEQRRPGRVAVRVGALADVIRIEVEDDGPGMPPGVRENLFEPFNSGKELCRANGLELAFLRQALERCGGKILGENLPRRGARFLIELPVHPRDSGRRVPAIAVGG